MKVCRWKCMTGRHIVPVDGQAEPDVYEPGDIIECTRKKLGNAIDKFELISEVEGNGDVVRRVRRDSPKMPKPKSERFRVKNLGSGRYNIISLKTGKKMNSEPLTRKEANEYMVDDAPEMVGAGRVQDDRVETE